MMLYSSQPVNPEMKSPALKLGLSDSITLDTPNPSSAFIHQNQNVYMHALINQAHSEKLGR